MNDLAHFAINADDVETSRQFYENVFGWTFTAWARADRLTQTCRRVRQREG